MTRYIRIHLTTQRTFQQISHFDRSVTSVLVESCQNDVIPKFCLELLYTFNKSSIVQRVQPIENHHISLVFGEGFPPLPLHVPYS